MASLANNPYKHFKRATKGKKLSGGEVHEFMKRKAPAPPKQDLGLAMKKKRKSAKSKAGSTIGFADVERKQAPHMAQTAKAKKRKAGGTTGMGGDVEHKGACKACKTAHKHHKHAKKA